MPVQSATLPTELSSVTSPRTFPAIMVMLVVSSVVVACGVGTPVDSGAPVAVPTTTPMPIEPTSPPAPTVASEDPPTPAAIPTAEAATTPTVEPPAPTDVTTLDGVALTFETVIELDGVPLALAAHPDGESLLVAQKSGLLSRWIPQPDGSYERVEPAVIDLRATTSGGSEQGLLGLAVAPDGEHMYVVHSDSDGNNRLLEFAIDGTEERELLVVDQPFANHNGGHLAFGPDGHLYYGLGDGGDAGDPLSTGQDPTDLLGSILRMAPNPDGDTYAIPSDNPFVDDAGGARPEVFAFGLRNPWRFSFDAATGDLWIGDVGQSEIEEIDLLQSAGSVPAGWGANLGWSAFEGSVPYGTGNPPDAIAPITQYTHDEGCSVTGGVVARRNHPAIEGVYIFGDYCGQWVRGLVMSGDGSEVVAETELGQVDGGLVSFGVGHAGELFVLLDTGVVQRILVS
jgi:glucose/arabinose dehydrogenase